MPASGSSIFTDADGYQASLRDMLDLLVPQPGEFNARLTWVELSELRLLRAQETAPRIAYMRLPSELVFATFVTRQGAPLIYSGAELQFGDIMLHGIGEHLHQRTTGATSWGSISLAPASLAAFGRTIGGRDLCPPAAERVLHPHPEDRQRLLRFHARACRIADTNPNLLRNTQVVRAVEQDMIWALVTCLTARDRQTDGSVRGEQARILVRLEKVLASHPYRPLTTPQICRAIGVSAHSLRSSCSAVLGMSPGRYQRLRRLKRVRAELMGAKTAPVAGTEMLARYGFTDLHRFIAEYWKAYGEVPPLPPRRIA